MKYIDFSDFEKVDIRAGRVVKAEDVRESDKLLRFVVDFGELGEKVVFSGIKDMYKPEELEGKLFTFVVNIKPKKIMGEMSEGMILEALDGEEYKITPLRDDITPGSKLC